MTTRSDIGENGADETNIDGQCPKTKEALYSLVICLSPYLFGPNLVFDIVSVHHFMTPSHQLVHINNPRLALEPSHVFSSHPTPSRCFRIPISQVNMLTSQPNHRSLSVPNSTPRPKSPDASSINPGTYASPTNTLLSSPLLLSATLRT